MDELIKYREKIDALDEQIISLIGQRINVCRQVANYKKCHNVPMMQPNRINQVIERCIQLGAKFSLCSTFIQTLYSEIIAEACRVEDKLIEG